MLRQAFVEFNTLPASAAAKHKIEEVAAAGPSTKNFAVCYTQAYGNPFRTLPKDNMTRKDDRSRMMGGTGYNMSPNMNYAMNTPGGYRNNRGGFNNRGMPGMGGYQNRPYGPQIPGGYPPSTSPFPGMAQLPPFNPRGAMMGMNMRGGPTGMRGRGGMPQSPMMPVPGMSPMGPMPGVNMGMGMPGMPNPMNAMMGNMGMPGKDFIQTFPFSTLDTRAHIDFEAGNQGSFPNQNAHFNPAFFNSQTNGGDGQWNPHGAKRTRQE